MRWAVALTLATSMARAEGEQAGDFDYYLLSMSWSPTWCTLEGEARNSPQCAEDANFGWVLHGLWPQYETGWPSFCRTTASDPSRAQTAEMADIMGTSGLAWYQWKKHGRCSGLGAQDYFEAARTAFESVTLPEVFQKLDQKVTLPATVIEDAFVADNPHIHPDMLTITCKAGYVQEARLCLTKDLEPRICGEDVIRDCALRNAILEPIE